jgi:Tfp pilus assembly protein PilZ
MTQNKDRRYSQRYHFDEAKVYCQENSTLRLFKQFSEPFDMNDLTKSGMCFRTNKKVSSGDTIHLKIEIPGHQKIQLKGRVVWVNRQPTSENMVGVQFLPFGTLKGYNTFSAREKLERLIGNSSSQSDNLQ